MARRWQMAVVPFAICAALLTQGAASAQGLIFSGAGGQHLASAGASTAVGTDALGALYWNPATISGLPGNEFVIGGNLLIPDFHLGSTIPAGAFGPLGPATTLTGNTRSDGGVAMVPGIAMVYRDEGSKLTYGLGLLALAAGGVNYPGDPGNPILAPVGPFSRFVLGPQVGTMSILSLAPSVSYQLTDRLAIGGGPMLDFSTVAFEPAFFGPPSDTNGDGLSTFPSGAHTRPFWGGGFRLGTTYKVSDHMTAGFSFTSPQWFETWQFNAATETGQPFKFATQFSLPTILSLGLAYTGIDRLLLMSDLRWFDYSTTKLLGQPAKEGGAGWQSIWAVATGAKYQLTDRLALQLGYLYNQNPIPDNLTLFNTMLPTITTNTLTCGTTYQISEQIAMSLAYIHGFQNSVTGSVFQLDRMNTTLDAEYDAIAFSLQIKFGGPPCRPRECSTCDPCTSTVLESQPRIDSLPLSTPPAAGSTGAVQSRLDERP